MPKTLKLALLNLHRWSPWRNLISAACVFNLILSVISQRSRLRVRIGIKIDECIESLALELNSLFIITAQCRHALVLFGFTSSKWLVNPCLYPECIAMYLGQTWGQPTEVTYALENNSDTHNSEPNHYKHCVHFNVCKSFDYNFVYSIFFF